MWNTEPGSNGVWPAGTAVGNTSAGSWYQYCAGSAQTKTQWTRYSGVIAGVNHTGWTNDCSFPAGTAFARPLLLIGYTAYDPVMGAEPPLTPSPTTVDMAHIRWVQVR
jgi:hypothetical protein